MITRNTLLADTPSAKGLQILLAEDNPVNQKLAIKMLEKRGHQIVVAGNGKEALAALAKRTYDLVLMDVQMPVMDGLEATRQLREMEKGAGRRQPVVAMTALVMKGDKERCMEAGMDGYISKPIRPQELDEVLDKYAQMAVKAIIPAPVVVRPSAQMKVIAKTSAPVPVQAAKPAVCMEELLERVDGDRTFLLELVELFRGDYPVLMKTARNAVNSGDTVSLQRAGHTLQGVLGNLAAARAADLAGELEAMASAGNMASAEGKMKELEQEVAQVMATLESFSMEQVR